MGHKVLVLMGSPSDTSKMTGASKALRHFGFDPDVRVLSAHRNPDKVVPLVQSARDDGYVAVICGAGMAAHLGGVAAAHTTLPVLGVPLSGGVMGGLDALLSTAQMPPGIPVPSLAVDGSANAGIFVAELLGVFDPMVAHDLQEFRLNGARTLMSHRGKVRNTYELENDILLMEATDRVSVFDVVLPSLVPHKGRVLTTMTRIWLEDVLKDIPNHLAPAGTPAPEWAGRLLEQGRVTLARKAQMFPVECIVRGYLFGSVMKEYKEHGTVCGIELPAGLQKASKLPEPIFTPSTKAPDGEHDVNISFDEMVELIGDRRAAEELRDNSLDVYNRGAAFLMERGIIMPDTKLEWGTIDGRTVLADEVLTPDSSRFWDAVTYQEGRDPDSFDKQNARDDIARRFPDWKKKWPAPGPLLPEVVELLTERYDEMEARISA